MKSLFKSKTFWTNVVGAAALVAPYLHPAGAVLADPTVQAQLVGAILAISNIGLRLITKEPVAVLPQ